MTDIARSILRNLAEQLLKHLDDPAADVATLCDQAEQSGALARAELEASTTVTTDGAAENLIGRRLPARRTA